MTRLQEVAKKTRKYDRKRPVPWQDRHVDGTVTHYSYAHEHYEQQRAVHEHRAQAALIWTKTQKASVEDGDAHNAGIGNWVILADDNAAKLRAYGLSVLNSGSISAKRDFESLKKLQFFCLPRSLEGAQERDLGIREGVYLDLPIASVRAIYLRIHNTRKKLKQKVSLRTEKLQNSIKRALKVLGCGQEVRILQGRVVHVTVKFCRQKSCGQHQCSLSAYHRNRPKYHRNLYQALSRASTAQNYRLVHLTMNTDWALPKDEPRRKPGAPVLSIQGQQAAHLKGGLPNFASSAINLYEQRLKQHLQQMRKFLEQTQVRKTIYRTVHRVTETAWLASSLPGRRHFPNPHTHAVIAVPANLDNEQVLELLNPSYKRIVPTGELHVSDLDYGSQEQTEMQAKRLGAYDAKRLAISATTASTELNSQDQRTLDIAANNYEPHASEVPVTLDDRSLAEAIEVEDFEDLRLYHADAKLDPTVKRTRKTVTTTVRLSSRGLGRLRVQRDMVFVSSASGTAIKRMVVNRKLRPPDQPSG